MATSIAARAPPPHTRVLSFDPGARRPGIAVVDLWWSDDPKAEWPRLRPLLLMGDPLVPSSIKNVKRYGSTQCVKALMAYFATHQQAMFQDFAPDVAIIETQKGLNNRLVDKLSVAMFIECSHAHELYGAPEDMRVTMCPATWKTQGLGVPPGTASYNARKEAAVAKTQDLLRANGFGATADNLVGHEAQRDVSDAFMQAVQFFMHTVKRHGEAGQKKKKQKRKRLAVAAAEPEIAAPPPAADDMLVCLQWKGTAMDVPAAGVEMAAQLEASVV